MRVLVCIKRVPETGARITLTPDEQEIDTARLGFTISPHEECALEEAIRIAEAHGGETAVLTLGAAAAAEQLRNAVAMGIGSAIHLETDGREWGPEATAAAIADAVRGEGFDLLLFGNESADSGGYQVGIRVAHLLGLPCVTGAKGIELGDGVATVRREAAGGWDIFETPLPAVVTVREGINLPRYPPLQGMIRAKRAEVRRVEPEWSAGGLVKARLAVPQEEQTPVEILGEGAGAATRVVEVLREIGVA